MKKIYALCGDVHHDDNVTKKMLENALGDDFILLTKEEVFDKNIFGFGTPHPRTNDFVGDFLAIATGEKSLFIKREEINFIGVHAGLTEDEMIVPFIAIET